MTIEKLKEFVAVNFPHIESDCTVAEVPKNDGVYHISKSSDIEEFIPMVSNRTLKEEDRSVPRICACWHLVGCIAGYSSTFSDFHNETEGFEGGYYIYELPVTDVVVPHKKLVPDAPTTDEVWVIGHDSKHRSVPPKIVGEFFITSIASEVVDGCPDEKKHDFKLYLSLNEPTKVNRDHTLTPGQFEVHLRSITSAADPFEELLHASRIPLEDYNTVKRLKASRLSFEGQRPSESW